MHLAERQFDRKLAAVRSHGRHFNAAPHQGAFAGRYVPREALPVGVAMHGRHDELSELASDDVSFLVAKRLLCGGIELYHSPPGTERDDAVESHFDDRSVVGFTRS